MDYVKQFPLRKFQRGELILQRGEPIESLFALRTGFVKVTSINADGIERLVWIAGRYDVAPTEQLFTRHGNTRFFYTALTDGDYYEIDKPSFLTMTKNNPELMAEIARSMSLHYDDFLYRVDAMDASTIKERLLRTLLYLAERLSADDHVNLYEHGLRLTHNDLAAMIGSTRETTSLMLSELRSDGFIEYSRKHFIVHVNDVKNVLEDSAAYIRAKSTTE